MNGKNFKLSHTLTFITVNKKVKEMAASASCVGTVTNTKDYCNIERRYKAIKNTGVMKCDPWWTGQNNAGTKEHQISIQSHRCTTLEIWHTDTMNAGMFVAPFLSHSEYANNIIIICWVLALCHFFTLKRVKRGIVWIN